MRHGATMVPTGSGQAPFLPLAMGGYAALTAQGAPERRLTGIDWSLRAALALCDRVAAWEARAARSIADLQGIPPRAWRPASPAGPWSRLLSLRLKWAPAAPLFSGT